MANEKEKIIKMLEDGKLDTEDAARLLEALGGDAPQRNIGSSQNTNPALKGKKLRVKVEGSVDEMQNINVNVAVPIALAKLADGIIANCVPKEARKAMEEQGIDISELRLGEIIDTLTDSDEDIVNVDLQMQDKPLTVRVYVE